MSERSQEGQGESVGIYMVHERSKDHPGDLCREDQYELDAPIQASVGEDYADCSWPVVVKVKRQVSKDELVDALERLTSKIRDGFFLHVTKRAEDYGPGGSICVLVPRPQAL